MDMLFDDTNITLEMGDLGVEQLLERVTPLVQRKRIQRSMDIARQNVKGSILGLKALLDLKEKTNRRYPFFHSILLPNQLASNVEPHIFKMSSVGPGSGVNLVNQMRLGGPLEKQFVHFDHVHRTSGWTTMSAHVYHPFVRELLTIAVGEFKVENTNAQVLFWTLMNERLQQCGFESAEFAGFMADEAQANWLAVHTIFNKGKRNVMMFKERSCSFHWEKSMLEHTRVCIKPQFQEEHKDLCRRWRDAQSEVSAESAKDKLVTFWSLRHAHEIELHSLETWLSWWERTELKSVMCKRRNMDARIVLDTDSHRPGYENVTIHVPRPKGGAPCVHGTPKEHEVDVKEWAIRRTPSKCQSTCWGILEGRAKHCGAFVLDKKEGSLKGVLAPCFKGRRQYKDKESWQMFYFCPSSVIHSVRVDEQIQKSCGPAPLLWKVARGTCLSAEETIKLINVGFILEGVKHSVSTIQTTPCNVRPTSRGDGRIVKWKEKISKASQDCINRALIME
ncbi:hypothetical protein L7F22_047638 [Adiantum nelumboides]|nr:hypothetical protein [Adiantum nelumboides]